MYTQGGLAIIQQAHDVLTVLSIHVDAPPVITVVV